MRTRHLKKLAHRQRVEIAHAQERFQHLQRDLELIEAEIEVREVSRMYWSVVDHQLRAVVDGHQLTDWLAKDNKLLEMISPFGGQ